MQQAFKESYSVDFRKNTELKSLIKNKTVLLFQPQFPCYIMDGTNATIFSPLQVQHNTHSIQVRDFKRDEDFQDL